MTYFARSVLFCLLLVGLQSASHAVDQEEFHKACLETLRSKPTECECLFTETNNNLPPAEAAFVLASVTGDQQAIQEFAANLSPERIQSVLFQDWVNITEKCLID